MLYLINGEKKDQEKCQEGAAIVNPTKWPGTDRRKQTERNKQERTSRMDQTGENRQDRTDRMEQTGWNRQEGTDRTEQTGENHQFRNQHICKVHKIRLWYLK
jgi:hypothetical protein